MKLPFRRNGALNTKLLGAPEINQLAAATKLPPATPKAQLAFHFDNQLAEIPRCGCGLPKKFKGYGKGYAASCGSVRCAKAQASATMVEKYGVANSFQLDRSKRKIKQTNLRRYGVEHNMQAAVVKEKARATNLRVRGVEWPTQAAEVLARRRENNLKKYGVEEPIQLEEVQRRVVTSNLKKYGVSWPSQLDSNRSKAKASRRNSENRARPNRLLFETKEQCEARYAELPNLFALANKFDVGHTWLSRTFRNFGLNVAQAKFSNVQREVAEFITLLEPTTILNDRSLIFPLELDILVPGKIAVEVDGIFWHSFNRVESKEEREYHLRKWKLCKEAGIGLIRITDEEWRLNRAKLQRLISSRLGHFKRRIAARKCEVSMISTALARAFLDEHHLQGPIGAKVNLGLFYRSELVGVATFGKPRYSKLARWELLRLCFAPETQVIGGFSKLLRAFRNHHGGNIISYVTRDKFDGGSYARAGFHKIRENGPSYYYWKDGTHVSRIEFQKHKLKGKLPAFDKRLTEAENCFAAGYRRYWDCGTEVWLLEG